MWIFSIGKVFNKRLDEKDKKERLLKRLKNIEGKNEKQLDEIEYQGERQLDMIDKHGIKHLNTIGKQLKNKKKEQLLKEIKRKEESGKNMLLKDVIYGEDGILLNYYQGFIDKGENVLKKVATDKKIIN